MKVQMNPAIAVTIIVVVLAVAVFLGWKKAGPPEAYTKPIDMGAMMRQGKANPSKTGAGPGSMNMGNPNQPAQTSPTAGR